MRPTITVLYGTETGTAAEVAERVAREGRRRAFKAPCTSMDAFGIAAHLPATPYCVFVVATTGDGDTPQSMKSAWRFLLQRRLGPASLAGLSFAVFGLGDSTYPRFNFVAKRLFNRLRQLGATPIVPLALGNDAHDLGFEAQLGPWLRDLWTTLLRSFPLSPDWPLQPDSTLAPARYCIEWVSDGTGGPLPTYQVRDAPTNAPFSQSNPFFATLASQRRLTAPTHFQDVRHLELDVSDAHVDYVPGDVLAVQPRNRNEAIEQLATLFQLDDSQLDRLVRVVPSCDDIEPLPLVTQPCTLRQLLTWHLDIEAVPTRYFFELLAHFTDSVLEAERLREFASPEGQDERFTYSNRVRRTILETFADFPGVHGRVPLAYLFDLVRPLQPRYFSIASSPLAHPSRIHLTVAIVAYHTRMSTQRHGVCTHWLAGLSPGARLPVWWRTGTLRLPPPSATPTPPLILVGPGTGCAPLHAMIHHRAAIAASTASTAAVSSPTSSAAPVLFFFGARSRTADFLYESDWSALVAQGHLELVTAFSRDQEDKIYVQHRIVEHGARVWRLINDGAVVYVAGAAKQMPQAVEQAFRDVARVHGKVKDDAAWFEGLRKARRYQAETWS